MRSYLQPRLKYEAPEPRMNDKHAQQRQEDVEPNLVEPVERVERPDNTIIVFVKEYTVLLQYGLIHLVRHDSETWRKSI